MNRREFLKGATAVAIGGPMAYSAFQPRPQTALPDLPEIGYLQETAKPLAYAGGPRNVVLVRYGGGIRRLESVGEHGPHYSPFFAQGLIPNGTLYNNLLIPWGVNTGHMEGTCLLINGRHDTPRDSFFEPNQNQTPYPTIFELFRKATGAGPDQAVMVNNEQLNTEFLSYGSADGYGKPFGASVLSLHGLAIWRHRTALKRDDLSDQLRKQHQESLNKLLAMDARPEPDRLDARLSDGHTLGDHVWPKFMQTFGGRPPKGDLFQTEAAIFALRELKPRLLMVNFQDCDYAHWGPSHFYHEGVRRMDQYLKRIVEEIQRNEFYCENTVVLIAPDVGRGDCRDQHGHRKRARGDYQHHMPDDLGSHETFMVAWGAGVKPGVVADSPGSPVSVTHTVGEILGFSIPDGEGQALLG